MTKEQIENKAKEIANKGFHSGYCRERYAAAMEMAEWLLCEMAEWLRCEIADCETKLLKEGGEK